MVSQQTDSAVGQLANQMGGGMHTTDNAATTQIADDPWLPVEFNPFANLHPCHIAGQIKHLPDLISIERIVETFSAAENDNSPLNDPTQSIAPLKRYRLNTQSMVAALPLDGEPVGVHLVFADDEPLICVTDRMRIHCYGLGEYSHSIDLPPLHVDEKEQAVWEQLEAGGLDLVSANQRLKQLALKGDGGSPPIRLTPLSMRLNSISETDAKFQLNDLLNQADEITCVAMLEKYEINERPPGFLLIGTDFGRLLLADTAKDESTLKCTLPCGIDALSVWGQHDVSYRVAILGRDNAVYLFDGYSCAQIMQIYSPVVTMLTAERTLFLATSNNSFGEYDMTANGKRVFQLKMPERILCMAKFNYRKRNIEGLMLSLANGSVRLYSRRQLVSEIQFEEPLLSLSFCHYKGEDNCVLGVTLTGGLSVHSLRRSSQLNLRELATGPPAEQDEPLPVPQKTKMYVEQRVREQQAPVEMHKRFQRDLQLLRLTVARAYKRSIEKALNPISAPVAIPGADNSISEGSLKMTAELFGLGPQFEIRLALEAVGEAPMMGLSLVCFRQQSNINTTRHQQPLSISPAAMRLPALIPGYPYRFTISLSFSDDKLADKQQQQVFANLSTTVLVQAIQFPMSLSSPDKQQRSDAIKGRVLISTAIELPPFIMANE